jgi:hypothetical protein
MPGSRPFHVPAGAGSCVLPDIAGLVQAAGLKYGSTVRLHSSSSHSGM